MNTKVTAGLLCFVLSLGVVFILISAKPNQEMKPAYCLFDNVHVKDPVKLEAYKVNVFKLVEKFGGRYVVAGGQLKKIEGSWNPHFLVMIEFPSFEQANNWYESDEYQELKALRHSSGKFDGIIMEGL